MSQIGPAKGSANANGVGERLRDLLAGDLDFQEADPLHPAHHVHPFPAKFPPQLPLAFASALSDPGALVLDPMCGSATTLLAVAGSGRQALGLDIDPLALLIGRVKTTPFASADALALGLAVADRAEETLQTAPEKAATWLQGRWRRESRRFVDYWFAPSTQLELAALVMEIEREPLPVKRRLLQVALSGIIIARSRSVSLALDIAHTRPHRAHRALMPDGTPLFESPPTGRQGRRQTKVVYPAPEEFRRRVRTIGDRLLQRPLPLSPRLSAGNARRLPLPAASVDLVVTSPPYAGNAIDYMRAHKYSLVWLGYPVPALGQLRKGYIGDESLGDVASAQLPARVGHIVATVGHKDLRKGRILHRYYSEMTAVLAEIKRVLRPGSAAVLVVGSSKMRGVDTETHMCLAEIGETIGLTVAGIGERQLHRDRRMMPATADPDLDSPIQRRMHHEYVIGFVKP